MIRAMAECPKPIIAAVEGGATEADVYLVLACALIVIVVNVYFSVAYVKVGLPPDGCAAALLSQAFPRQLMFETCLAGDKFQAAWFLETGLMNRVVSTGSALSEGWAWLALGKSIHPVLGADKKAVSRRSR